MKKNCQIEPVKMICPTVFPVTISKFANKYGNFLKVKVAKRQKMWKVIMHFAETPSVTGFAHLGAYVEIECEPFQKSCKISE